jgi:hypothetical protein
VSLLGCTFSRLNYVRFTRLFALSFLGSFFFFTFFFGRHAYGCTFQVLGESLALLDPVGPPLAPGASKAAAAALKAKQVRALAFK